MSSGKQLRLRRIIDPETHKSVMFAFSHGTSAPQVMDGLENPHEMVAAAARGGADCVFMAPGLIEAVAPSFSGPRSFGFVTKITSTASRGAVAHQERLICSVERSVELGADGVVAMLPFAPENEPDVIRLTAEIGEACGRLGVPFVAEAEYPNSYYGSDTDYATEWGLPYLKRSARLCAELGADVVKSNWTGSAESFAEIVDCVPVPVVVAGGARGDDLALLRQVAEALSAGAIGISIGRNIFQHTDPEAMTSAVCAVVKEGWSPEKALDQVLGGPSDTQDPGTARATTVVSSAP
jgi:DhnA family fructose-bisphosphate aldolase class Ia